MAQPQASCSMGIEEARRGVKALQAPEREMLRQAGRRKLNELRSLKAAAMQLVQAHTDAKQQTAAACSSKLSECCAESCQQEQHIQRVQDLPVLQEQLHSSTGNTAPVLCNSNNPVSTAPQKTLEGSSTASGQLLKQPQAGQGIHISAVAAAAGAAAVAATAAGRAALPAGSARQGSSAAPAALEAGDELLQNATDTPEPAGPGDHQQQQQGQQQEHVVDSMDVGQYDSAAAAGDSCGDQDPMVDLLLQQVEALMSEKQQLAARCCGLERENEQLAELVGHLHDSLEEQHDLQQLQPQMQLPALHILEPCIPEEDELAAAGCSSDGNGDAAPGYSGAAGQVYSPTSDEDEVMVTASLEKLDPPGGADVLLPAGALGMAAIAMPVAAAGQLCMEPEQLLLSKQKQQRVADWLRRPGSSSSSSGSSTSQSWQEWQEQLPLEAMSSGSGSTATMTLADA